MSTRNCTSKKTENIGPDLETLRGVERIGGLGSIDHRCRVDAVRLSSDLQYRTDRCPLKGVRDDYRRAWSENSEGDGEGEVGDEQGRTVCGVSTTGRTDPPSESHRVKNSSRVTKG